jgi:hypothetical protein
MNGEGPSRPKQALWLMLAVSAAAVIFRAAFHYTTCRNDGGGQIACLIAALLGTGLEAVVLIVVTIFRLLKLILP